MGWKELTQERIEERLRCRDCGMPFTQDRPRYPRTLRCNACYREAKRQIDRAYYVRHNADRLGEPTGRKPGQANAAEFRTVAFANRIAEANERTRQELARLPRQLARTCPFCRMLAVELGLLATERCSLDREPDDSGGCGAWEPRYRVDGDE
jgi:protein-arginine kinase activator protein McsA